MIRVFGITGTNGKTTASCMLREILERESGSCGLIGTIQYCIGEKTYDPPNTTPGKEILKQLFHELKEQEISQCVMEVSSHGIAQGRVSGIRFAGVGFTNLSQDHLDYHKTMEQYYQTKKQLFLQCRGNCVINMDDTYGRRLYEELTDSGNISRVKSFSMEDTAADYYGRLEEESLLGSRIIFYDHGILAGNFEIRIPGRHFASNAMLAAAMAREAGTHFALIQQGLRDMRRVPGRMELIGSKEDTLGVVDYAHTPDGLEKLLKTLTKLKRGKLICVFGCGGFRDKGKRKIMGEIAGRYSDYCIITNDNPRGEPPENIAQAIEEGLYFTGCEYVMILDRYQAIKRAVSLADKWDIIVVAGKGHETWQLSGNEKLPFDDRKVLKELLEKKYETTYNETN